MDALNDPTFVRKLMAGDAIAFSVLCNALKTKLPAFIAKEVGLSHADAEEVAGDVYFKLHSSISRYEQCANVKFTPWLFQIAKNAAIDHKRKLTSKSPSETNAEQASIQQDPKRVEFHIPTGLRFNIEPEADPRHEPKMAHYKTAFEKLDECEKDIRPEQT